MKSKINLILIDSTISYDEIKHLKDNSDFITFDNESHIMLENHNIVHSISDSLIDKTEIDKFKNLAKEWWKHDGKFKTLHKFNPIRLEYIINTIKDHYAIDRENESPLKGLSVVDIGCGG